MVSARRSAPEVDAGNWTVSVFVFNPYFRHPQAPTARPTPTRLQFIHAG